MEVKVESKIGLLRNDNGRVYYFLSDCNNFQQFATNDKVKNWRSNSDSCNFSVDSVGDLGLHIVERREGELIKFSIASSQADNSFLWVQLKSADTGDTRLKLTVKSDVNPVVSMFVSKPLKSGLDKIVDTLEHIFK